MDGTPTDQVKDAVVAFTFPLPSQPTFKRCQVSTLSTRQLQARGIRVPGVFMRRL